MDGDEGEGHVHLGAKIMGLLVGTYWADFTLRHSRYWAKKHGVTVSKLCYADKLAFVLTPGWLYLPMARATGELAEYMAKSLDRQAGCDAFSETERGLLESGKPDLWLQGFRTTPGAGWNNIETAEPTIGPSSGVAPLKDRGSERMTAMDTITVTPRGRHCWRRLAKWQRGLLIVVAVLVCSVWIGIGSIALFVLLDSPLGCPPTMGCPESKASDCSISASRVSNGARLGARLVASNV